MERAAETGKDSSNEIRYQPPGRHPVLSIAIFLSGIFRDAPYSPLVKRARTNSRRSPIHHRRHPDLLSLFCLFFCRKAKPVLSMTISLFRHCPGRESPSRGFFNLWFCGYQIPVIHASTAVFGKKASGFVFACRAAIKRKNKNRDDKNRDAAGKSPLRDSWEPLSENVFLKRSPGE